MIDKFQSSLSLEPQPVSSRQHARLNFYKFAAFVRVRVAYNTSLLLYLLAHLLLLLQFEHCAAWRMSNNMKTFIPQLRCS